MRKSCFVVRAQQGSSSEAARFECLAQPVVVEIAAGVVESVDAASSGHARSSGGSRASRYRSKRSALAPGDAEAADPRAGRHEPVDEQEGSERPAGDAPKRAGGDAKAPTAGRAPSTRVNSSRIQAVVQVVGGAQDAPDRGGVGLLEGAQGERLLRNHDRFLESGTPCAARNRSWLDEQRAAWSVAPAFCRPAAQRAWAKDSVKTRIHIRGSLRPPFGAVNLGCLAANFHRPTRGRSQNAPTPGLPATNVGARLVPPSEGPANEFVPQWPAATKSACGLWADLEHPTLQQAQAAARLDPVVPKSLFPGARYARRTSEGEWAILIRVGDGQSPVASECSLGDLDSRGA